MKQYLCHFLALLTGLALFIFEFQHVIRAVMAAATSDRLCIEPEMALRL